MSKKKQSKELGSPCAVSAMSGTRTLAAAPFSAVSCGVRPLWIGHI